MLSYRHSFHAGNHADVLKHTVLLAALRYMKLKDTALNVFDTHAGAGLYRLDGDYARPAARAHARAHARTRTHTHSAGTQRAMRTYARGSRRPP